MWTSARIDADQQTPSHPAECRPESAPPADALLLDGSTKVQPDIACDISIGCTCSKSAANSPVKVAAAISEGPRGHSAANKPPVPLLSRIVTRPEHALPCGRVASRDADIITLWQFYSCRIVNPLLRHRPPVTHPAVPVKSQLRALQTRVGQCWSPDDFAADKERCD